MCPYSHVKNQITHGEMPIELFKKIVDECAKYDIKEFKPFLMNEPLIDKRLPELLKYARQKLPRAIIGFSTNGMLLKDSVAEELSNVGLDELWINFSGNTYETYNKVMRGLDYTTVKNNIINFSELVKEKKSFTKVYISMVEIRDSVNEIDDSISFWANYGVTVVPIPYNNRGGNCDDVNIKILDKPIGLRPCDKPNIKLCILYNGDVVLCPADWQRKNIMGNVLIDSIKDVWNGEKRRWYIEKILKCDYSKIELCQNCDFPLIFE
jgi:radical SAM protein with 4Fe4S-binding SPASM domain